jgi:hypothetical protein
MTDSAATPATRGPRRRALRFGRTGRMGGGATATEGDPLGLTAPGVGPATGVWTATGGGAAAAVTAAAGGVAAAGSGAAAGGWAGPGGAAVSGGQIWVG